MVLPDMHPENDRTLKILNVERTETMLRFSTIIRYSASWKIQSNRTVPLSVTVHRGRTGRSLPLGTRTWGGLTRPATY